MPDIKLHKNLCEGIVSSLQKIFGENKYSDKVIFFLFKDNKKWGARDRGFVAETIYDIVRNWRLLWAIADKEPNVNPENLWTMLGIYLKRKNIPLADWKEFDEARNIDADKNFEELKIRESIPDWLDELGEKELDNKWKKEIHSLNQQADVYIRTNTLKTNREELKKILAQQNIETESVDGLPDCLLLKCRKSLNTLNNDSYRKGFFEVQDAASQMVASSLIPEPGMRVIDACAGGGGKSLHLAAEMKNKGRIIAMDTEQWKLDELKKRARRNGVSIVETRLIDNSKVIKRLAGSADRLLLDVPCTGLGTLRRKPDIKWKLSQESFERVKTLQQDLLVRYSQMLKPGGLMVYSTCSVLPSENTGQIKKFLDSNKDFELLSEKSLLCSETGWDGFYISVVRRIK